MTFTSNRGLAIAGGLIVGIGGLFSVIVWFTQAHEMPGLFALLGPVELLVSGICLTYRGTAVVDKEKGQVRQEWEVLFLRFKRQTELRAFDRVGVGAAGGGQPGRGSFFVDLVGEQPLGLPGLYGDRNAAWAQAKRLAAYLDLPLDERVRVAFFAKRY